MDEKRRAWKEEERRQRKLAKERIHREQLEMKERLLHSTADYFELKKFGILRVPDISGYIFQELKVIEKTDPHITSGGNEIQQYICECSCGRLLAVKRADLVNKKIIACPSCTRKLKKER